MAAAKKSLAKGQAEMTTAVVLVIRRWGKEGGLEPREEKNHPTQGSGGYCTRARLFPSPSPRSERISRSRGIASLTTNVRELLLTRSSCSCHCDDGRGVHRLLDVRTTWQKSSGLVSRGLCLRQNGKPRAHVPKKKKAVEVLASFSMHRRIWYGRGT